MYHTIASGYATYKPVELVSATYRFGVDQFSDNRTATAPGPQGVPDEIIDEDNGYGFVRQIQYQQPLDQFQPAADLRSYLGKISNDTYDWEMMCWISKQTTTSTKGDTLDVYNLFNLSNAKKITASNQLTQYRIVGLYGELALNYDQFLYLSVTGRNDWTSTLEADNRSFFYSSVSLGYIFTQQIKICLPGLPMVNSELLWPVLVKMPRLIARVPCIFRCPVIRSIRRSHQWSYSMDAG